MNDNQIIVNKSWLLQLEDYVKRMSANIDSSEDFDKTQKLRIHLLASTVYGFTSSVESIVDSGSKLAAIQNDRLANYKQTVGDTLDQIHDLREMVMPTLSSPAPSLADALDDPINKETVEPAPEIPLFGGTLDALDNLKIKEETPQNGEDTTKAN
jgi:hypothetical protein